MKKILKKCITAIKKLPIAFLGCLILIVMCVVTLGIMSKNPSQSFAASPLTATFQGKYKIEDGEWQDIPNDGHITSTQGKVTLLGKFIVLFPDGTFLTDNPENFYFNFYCNHIFVKVRVGEETVALDMEHPKIGVDACGVMWSAYYFPEGTDGLTEITISNPHKHGNEMAIDEFLASISMEDPTLLDESLAKQYDRLRYVGFSFAALALVVFVLTVVAWIAKLKIEKLLWIIGFWILFTGGFYILDVGDVFFWNENVPFNTTALCLCQILSSFFLSLFAISCFSGNRRKIAYISQGVIGGVIFLFSLLSACKVVRIFDMRFYYYVIYALHFGLICALSIMELPKAENGIRFVLIGTMVSMGCVVIDLLGISLALWKGWYLSKVVFGGMLFVVSAFGVNAIISNYKMSIRAKEMEGELKNKSIAVMISQIQPHFLYNSLNSIAELCVVDPKRAEKATIDFSRYLRGNMGALNEIKTIEFEDELKHLSHYIELEKLRYGDDLQFEYDIREQAFTLPALTVQPLVENAVNHGIRYHKMKGKVKISSFSDNKNCYVKIEDDGVGFDPNEKLDDGRKHVGIANVKYRLEVLCNGSLEIQSKKGNGTVVTIRIPKEK